MGKPGRKPVEREIIQLRVSPEDFADLKRGAVEHGWSVPMEVRDRLNKFRVGGFGFDEAIGELAAIVARRAQEAPVWYGAAEGEPDYRLLGIVRDALAAALTKLGAVDSGDLAEMTVGITYDLAQRIRGQNPGDSDPEGQRLARIGRALGFRKAEPDAPTSTRRRRSK